MTKCIANVGGNCAVENCKGEITGIDINYTDLDQAARFYEIAATVFEVEFERISKEEAQHGH